MRVPSSLGTGSRDNADLMYAAWKLFEGRSFDGFHDLRAALAHELGDLGDEGHVGHAHEPNPPAPVAYRGPRPAVLPVPFHGYRVTA